MKLNEGIMIEEQKVILVPYEKHHVEKYHLWMQNEELLKLTASERLTLEEEYHMQNSWRIDENKCTFIVLDKDSYYNSKNEIESMVGDINLFLNSEDNCLAEVSMMIAEEQARGKGLGKEALMTMMMYSIRELKINKFIAKISLENIASQNFFSKNGFIMTEVNDVFQEVSMEKSVDNELLEHLKSNVSLNILTYNIKS